MYRRFPLSVNCYGLLKCMLYVCDMHVQSRTRASHVTQGDAIGLWKWTQRSYLMMVNKHHVRSLSQTTSLALTRKSCNQGTGWGKTWESSLWFLHPNVKFPGAEMMNNTTFPCSYQPASPPEEGTSLRYFRSLCAIFWQHAGISGLPMTKCYNLDLLPI